MTDRKQALIDLRERVKSDKDWHFDEFDPDDLLPLQWLDAFHGSLDAAKALHEAVLPGWHWSLHETEGTGNPLAAVEPPKYHLEPFVGQGIHKNNPARAWLIAILGALIAKEDHTND